MRQLLRVLPFGRLVSFAPTEEPGGNSGDDGEGGNIVGNDGAGTNNGTFSNTDPRKEDGAGADVGPLLNMDRLDLKVGFDDRAIIGNAGVG